MIQSLDRFVEDLAVVNSKLLFTDWPAKLWKERFTRSAGQTAGSFKSSTLVLY